MYWGGLNIHIPFTNILVADAGGSGVISFRNNSFLYVSVMGSRVIVGTYPHNLNNCLNIIQGDSHAGSIELVIKDKEEEKKMIESKGKKRKAVTVTMLGTSVLLVLSCCCCCYCCYCSCCSSSSCRCSSCR